MASFLEAAIILTPLMVNSCYAFGWHFCLSDGMLPFGTLNLIGGEPKGKSSPIWYSNSVCIPIIDNNPFIRFTFLKMNISIYFTQNPF